ncbi:hypothetical protein LX32DRAFT_107059 [Colletotrichum zoysiae]|uniref:Uncharacterized protein n=1 Tax=Colletotrichum zoysiae TaxID=1216348 RepID=A0AAD9HRU7_9PEZI|nr:hypothetical protein LX32DRAFT_107059 [Colletotrichum zoysiae]
MAGLLALVADLLAAGRLLRAIAGEVAVLAAVVALGAVGAVAWEHMSVRKQHFMDAAETYETCGRSRRKSSRSSGWHRRSRRRHHRSRRRSRLGRRRSHRRTWGSCGQCDRPHRTANALASRSKTLRIGGGSTNLVALGAGGAAAATDVASLGAVAADVASLAAAVAGLGVLGALRAVTIPLGGATVRALAGLDFVSTPKAEIDHPVLWHTW